MPWKVRRHHTPPVGEGQHGGAEEPGTAPEAVDHQHDGGVNVARGVVVPPPTVDLDVRCLHAFHEGGTRSFGLNPFVGPLVPAPPGPRRHQ